MKTTRERKAEVNSHNNVILFCYSLFNSLKSSILLAIFYFFYYYLTTKRGKL
jgi:hypothetical protein